MSYERILTVRGMKTVLLVAICFLFNVANGQISGGELKSTKEKKKKKEKVEKEDEIPFDASELSGSSFYLSGLTMRSFRSFEDQTISGVYSDLEAQEPRWTYGVSAGIVIPFSASISLDIGATYFGFGEQFSYSDPETDSTYHYSNSYAQAGIPIKLRYTYGNDFQFFAFAGITPSNILNRTTKSNYTTAEGNEVENDDDSVEQGYTQFQFMLTVGGGVNYYFKQLGITLYPEFRRNLTNTYGEDVLKRDHKMYGVGLNLGLSFRF